MPSAVELSAYVALVGVGLLAANLLLGLLMAAGYNPARHWPHRAVKLFRLHNWTGYIALATAIIHPAILLFSSSPRFHSICSFPYGHPSNLPRMCWAPSLSTW
jgi:hypothetical protein